MMAPQTVNEWVDYWRNDIGVNVIPANTKEKRTWVEWQQWQDKPIPLELHEEWKQSGAFDTGVAVIVGKAHHNPARQGQYLYCIDFDNKKAIEEFFPNGTEKAKANTLLEWHDDDPTRLHMYGFSTIPLPKKSSDKSDNPNSPAIEVKGKGQDGIMFCTPSIHKDGHPYRTGPCIVPKLTDGIEQQIHNILHMHGIPYLTKNGDDNKIPMVDLLAGNIVVQAGHNRHEAVLRIAEHYVATIPKINETSLTTLTDQKNNEVCNPPLEKSEVKRICEQAALYVEKTIGLPKVLDQAKQQDKEEKRKEHVMIAQQIMAEHHFVTLENTHEVLVYSDGAYRYGGEEIVSQEARSIEYAIKNHEISEVIAYIRDATGYHSVDEFDIDIYRLNLRNGIVDIRTGKLESHNPAILTRIQLPVIFKPEAIPTQFLRYLASVHDEVKTKRLIVEMMALTLIKTPTFHKAFVHIGDGSNGKTVMLNMLGAVLGKENIATQTIQSLQHNRFATASLDGKLANIAGDIDPDALKGTGRLKDIIGGGILSAEKKFKGTYNFVNFATLIFSANQIPEVSDTTDGFARRFVIVEWHKQFLGDAENHDFKLMHHSDNEISGVLNLMIKNVRKLIETNHLTYEPDILEMKRLWKEKSNSIEAFFHSDVIFGNDKGCTSAEIYKAYVEFCRKSKRMIKQQNTVTKLLKMRGCESTKTRVKGLSVNKWIGCGLKDKKAFDEV